MVSSPPVRQYVEEWWLTSTDSFAMYRFVTRLVPSPLTMRKTRLFCCACNRQCCPPGNDNGYFVREEEDHDDDMSAFARSWCETIYHFGCSGRHTHAKVANLLRDTVGNPFQTRVHWWQPGSDQLKWLLWNDGTALKLATVAYRQRLPDGSLDPEQLAVLADALEDAGCRDDHVLRPLRGEEWLGKGSWLPARCAAKYRGFYVLDDILGLDG